MPKPEPTGPLQTWSLVARPARPCLVISVFGRRASRPSVFFRSLGNSNDVGGFSLMSCATDLSRIMLHFVNTWCNIAVRLSGLRRKAGERCRETPSRTRCRHVDRDGARIFSIVVSRPLRIGAIDGNGLVLRSLYSRRVIAMREQEAVKFLPISQTVQSRPISPLSFHGPPLSLLHRERERTRRLRESRMRA